MSRKTTALTQAALSLLHATGAGGLLAPFTRGKGVIFTLHNVRPEPPEAFEPNRILKITPEFLETAIETVQKAGYDIVSLDEAARRMKSTEPSQPFACFTFDDGYRDNRDFAYPVFKKHGLPFAIYVATDYADGHGELWWFVLENAIRKADRVRLTLDGVEREFESGTIEAKYDAFHEIYWALRDRPEVELRAAVRRIAEEAGYDWSALCRDLVMTWDELRELAADPLVTIGAHTRRHFAVGKLAEDDARAEIAESVVRIEGELGRPCRHFSFPYGDSCAAGERDFAIAKSLGLETAVTTRKDVMRGSYTMTSLPRVSLNGDYQEPRYVEVMMTGVPFRIFDAAKAVLDPVRSFFRTRNGAALPASATRPGAASI
ncbi:MAG TPA: polysaccharide deacetylase family protein [Hyphomicrobium sp.]|nr:polysaccharide deacetylase family protein [Hyphomicrobium sp.]